MQTHRCKSKNPLCVGIKKDYVLKPDGFVYPGWRIIVRCYDHDKGRYNEMPLERIKYCPFCGKKLEDEK